jgi:hypothetical protein
MTAERRALGPYAMWLVGGREAMTCDDRSTGIVRRSKATP